jgi:anti-sigma B factor antagonist
MTCEVEKRDGLLRIRGEMTIYGAAALKGDLFAALEEEKGGCTLDLADVSELDTTGVQILLMAQRACVARGASFALANPSEIVRETLGLLRPRNLPVTTSEVGS